MIPDPNAVAYPAPNNLFPVQFRNINVGMFSGRRPSYQRYSASPAAADVVKKTILKY